MKKTKKDQSKAAKTTKTAKSSKAPKKKTVLKSLKKLSKKSGLSKLSTTQKVVGGAALLAAGLGILAQRSGVFADVNLPDTTGTDAAKAEENLNSLDGGDA